MNKATCQTIQSELDLSMLGEQYSPEVSAHLNECAVCNDFQAKQTKLREIVGSLGTVSAPADFDFKLRARLANERHASGLPVGPSWLFGPRTVALGSALVVVFLMVVLTSFKWKPAQQASTETRTVESIAVAPSKPSVEEGTVKSASPTVISPKEAERRITPEVLTARNNRNQRVTRRSLEAADFSSVGVDSIKPSSDVDASEAVFSIETSQQPYRVSLYDGRGKARTISVPPVSFGSQRAIPTSNQFAPKGIW